MQFIKDIRDRLRLDFPGAYIVAVLESNLGKESRHLQTYIADDQFITTMMESGNGCYGVRKTEDTTWEMYRYTKQLMASRTMFVTENCIGIPSPSEWSKRGHPGSPEASVYMVNKLEKQLQAYRFERKLTSLNNMSGRGTHYLTGKGLLNDDTCIAFMMIWWRLRFWSSASILYMEAKIAMGVIRRATAGPMPGYVAPRGVPQNTMYSIVSRT
jgi:hypothetical protein